MLQPRGRLGFVIAAALVAILCARIASVPINILYGKTPDPPWDLVMTVVLRQALPILIIPLLMIWLAYRLLLRHHTLWAILLLLAAPAVALAILPFVVA
jgi:hypothetical protein